MARVFMGLALVVPAEVAHMGLRVLALVSLVPAGRVRWQ